MLYILPFHLLKSDDGDVHDELGIDKTALKDDHAEETARNQAQEAHTESAKSNKKQPPLDKKELQRINQFWEVLPLIKEHCENCPDNLMQRNLYDLNDHPEAELIDTSICWINVNPLCKDKIDLEPIHESEILKPRGVLKAPRTTRLYGQPGGGKSLIEEHIVLEWSKEFLKRTEKCGSRPTSWEEVGLRDLQTMMVYVPTQKIGPDRSMEDAIRACLWCEKEEDKDKLLEYVMQGYGVVVFLDGLDEIRSPNVRKVIQQYVEERKKYGGAQVLVSARTDLCWINSKQFDRFLSLPGFTEDQYRKYITKYLTEYKYGDLNKVLQCINPELQPILTNPLHLHIMCALLSKGELCADDLSNLSILKLFKVLVKYLKAREGDMCSGEETSDFYRLCLYGFLKDVKEFNEEITPSGPMTLIKEMKIPLPIYHCSAFMKKQTSCNPEPVTKWCFPHEMIHECFATLYLETLTSNELKFFLLRICLKKEFRNLQKMTFELLHEMGGEYRKLLQTMIRCILVLQHQDNQSKWYKFKAFFWKNNHYDILKELETDVREVAAALDTDNALWEYLVKDLPPTDMSGIWRRIDQVFDNDVNGHGFLEAQWYHGLKEGVIEHVTDCLKCCSDDLQKELKTKTVNRLLPQRPENNEKAPASWILGNRRLITYFLDETVATAVPAPTLLSKEVWGEMNIWPISILRFFVGVKCRLKLHAWSLDEARMLIDADSKSGDAAKRDKNAELIYVYLNKYRDIRGVPPEASWSEHYWSKLIEKIKKRWPEKDITIEVHASVSLKDVSSYLKSFSKKVKIRVMYGKIDLQDLITEVQKFAREPVQLDSTTIVMSRGSPTPKTEEERERLNREGMENKREVEILYKKKNIRQDPIIVKSKLVFL